MVFADKNMDGCPMFWRVCFGGAQWFAWLEPASSCCVFRCIKRKYPNDFLFYTFVSIIAIDEPRDDQMS